jgi:hypothetical protein
MPDELPFDAQAIAGTLAHVAAAQGDAASVFVRGGKDYRRIEPAFIVVKDGMVAVIEVDGDTVHQESPVEAHDRTTMLVHEGAHVERVRASDCSTMEGAEVCAKRVLTALAKVRAAK